MALQHDVNETPIDGAAAVLQLVTVLLAAGWSIHAYGDGTTRTGSGAGFTVASLRNLSHAWVAVVAPAGTDTVVFQRSTAGAADNTSWWVAYASDGLLTNGDGTTVDSEATAGNLQSFRGTGGSTPAFAQLFAVDAAGGAFRCSAVADDATPYGWHLCAWNPGTGAGRTLIMFDPITNRNPADTGVYKTTALYRGSAPWCGDLTPIAEYNNTPSYCWELLGGPSPHWRQTSAGVVKNYINTVTIPGGGALNAYDGNDDLQPITHYTWDGGTAFRPKGTGTLAYWVVRARATGDTLDIVGETDDRIIVGYLALPWPHGVAGLV